MGQMGARLARRSARLASIAETRRYSPGPGGLHEEPVRQASRSSLNPGFPQGHLNPLVFYIPPVIGQYLTNIP